MKRKARAAKAKRGSGKTKRALSKREICKLCGCHSGKKWEECCGRCSLPC